MSLGLQVRTANKLKVRQPLTAVEIVPGDPVLEPALRSHAELVRDELNVHEIHFVAAADEYVTYRIKPNFRALGPRVGKRMPKLKAALAEADGGALLRELEADGSVTIDVDGDPIALDGSEIAVDLEAREGFAAAAGTAGVVVLRTALTPELLAEGLFREVLNRVQGFRKELDLEYTGRIRLSLDGSSRLIDAVRPRSEELGRETLAVEVVFGVAPEDGAHVLEASIDGEALVVGLSPTIATS